MNGMLYLCLNSFISFPISVSDTFLKDKLKLHFSRIVLILGWFWYLYSATKISSPFSGVWQSKLLGTLRPKLDTKFWKYLLKVSAISKSSVSRLPFSIRDIFSKLFNCQRRNFTLFSKTFYYLLHLLRSDSNSMPFRFSLTHLFLCLLHTFFVTFGYTFKEFFS